MRKTMYMVVEHFRSDLVEFEAHPVMPSKDAAEKIGPKP